MEKQTQQEFIVTARKFRPQCFHDVVGQDHISDTLKNAIRSQRVHHAYLFCGPRGVGKTTSARIFARALNCEAPVDFEPCNECEACVTTLEGRSMDVFEIDGASNNSVEDIRILRENVKYPPSTGKYKIYIIDEVHMLSKQAFNALLKTLEEPPKHLIFIFATTEAHKVLPTIISRCQRFDFRRMEIPDIVGQLKYIAGSDNVTIDEESLITIAKKADGSMRDSQSIYDQVVAFCGKDISYKKLADSLNLIDEDFYFSISDAIHQKNTAQMLLLCDQVVQKGYGILETMQGLLEHLRNIIAIKLCPDKRLVDTSESFFERYKQSAAKFEKNDIIRMMNLVNTAEQQIRFSPQPRIRFELALIQLSNLNTSVEISKLINEIRTIPEYRADAQMATLGVDQKKNDVNPVHQAPRVSAGNIPVRQETQSSPQATQNKSVEDPQNLENLNPIEKQLIEEFGARLIV